MTVDLSGRISLKNSLRTYQMHALWVDMPCLQKHHVWTSGSSIHKHFQNLWLECVNIDKVKHLATAPVLSLCAVLRPLFNRKDFLLTSLFHLVNPPQMLFVAQSSLYSHPVSRHLHWDGGCVHGWELAGRRKKLLEKHFLCSPPSSLFVSVPHLICCAC